MVTGKSRTLGVFTSTENAEITIRILAGAMEAANQNEYFLKVMHLHYFGIDDSTISRCVEWQIAGAMIVGIGEESQERLDKEMGAKKIPLVMVDSSPSAQWGIRILSDDDQGIRQVVAHLLELGHRRIAYLGGRPGELSTRRERSFRVAMTDCGLDVPESWVRNTSWGDQAVIEEGVRALLKTEAVVPTAIVCSGDNLAMIVLRIAASLGLRVPEDLSVTGYSKADLGSFTTPPLTSVEQPFHAMGHAATQYLVDCDQSIDTEGHQTPLKSAGLSEIWLPTKLIVRASTARTLSVYR